MNAIKVEKTATGEAGRISPRWIKSESSTCYGQCVEVAKVPDGVAVRDSKDPDGPRLDFTAAEFNKFLDDARNGQFDCLVR